MSCPHGSSENLWLQQCKGNVIFWNLKEGCSFISVVVAKLVGRKLFYLLRATIHMALQIHLQLHPGNIKFTQKYTNVTFFEVQIQFKIPVVRSEPRADLAEILGRPCGHRRGVGNSFQPAIDAPRCHLIDCVIAPSAKMQNIAALVVSILLKRAIWLQTLWGLRQLEVFLRTIVGHQWLCCSFLTYSEAEVPHLECDLRWLS
jgi:hypothetical protein